VREPGVWHEHLMASCITELETWQRYRGLCSEREVLMLIKEGFVVRLADGREQLTPKGAKELERVRVMKPVA
jgi:hypothetical protein